MANIYLDVAGFTLRTVMPSGDVALVEQKAPGFIAAQLAIIQSKLNSRLRKRYAIPLGTEAGPFFATGTTPPGVTLSGVPALGSIQLVVKITTPGALGTAAFQWSADGGASWNGPLATAATVTIGATGITATFAAGTYALDNLYTAAPPVPEIVLGWMAKIATPDVYRKRGVAPTDPQLELVEKDRDAAWAEIKEAADSKEGLFDLPPNEVDASSAVVNGGPLFYSEQSPYVWADQQADVARLEDQNGGPLGR